MFVGLRATDPTRCGDWAGMDSDGPVVWKEKLGDVMKESAHLAISWLRSNAKT
ncbi:hypothetical protein M9458_036199, partial [Cirrhinus mrigala]